MAQHGRNHVVVCPMGDWQIEWPHYAYEDELLLIVIEEILREHLLHDHQLARTHHPAWRLGPVSETSTAQRAAAALAASHSSWDHPGKQRSPDVSFTLKDNQQVDLSLTFQDAAGNATVDTGALAWASSDDSVLVVVDNGNGSATAVAQGPVGSATVTVTDTETNGQQFIGSLAIDVVGGDTAAITVVAGTPVDKPVA
jgi:hypothetical protein